MSKLSDQIQRSLPVASKEPLWQGPEKDGITFSLLSRFLVCRERFRLLVVKGLQPAPAFNHRLEYGSMFHVCLEAISSEVSHFGEVVGTTLWEDNLKKYAQFLCAKYPTAQQEVEKWYQVCRVQFPLYVEYWDRKPEFRDWRSLLQEQTFNVPYSLPSGRVVRLRGKWDGVMLAGNGDQKGIYLFETKTKGEIVESQIARQLNFDLQTMLYLVALQESTPSEVGRLNWSEEKNDWLRVPIRGVLYNVIRRPLSGGKGSIVQYKPSARMPMGESDHSFYQRLSQVIREDPNSFFMRWQVEITQEDIKRFRRECLDPILEQLCDWWQWISSHQANVRGPFDSAVHRGVHWRHPFGCYNALDEGGSTDLDSYLATGSEVGLHRATTLFPELDA